MANRDRLTGLDASFLHLERGSVHMHVASCQVFEGPLPDPQGFEDHVAGRLHLVPRYRQRLAFVPFEQGRPVWVDDPHFNVRFHVRHSALPPPGSEAELKRLCGRVFSQRLDRARPLWEIWLVEGLDDDRFAVLSKVHHALVDGISGVDITNVMFDASADPAPTPEPSQPWVPRPLPSEAQLLADALLERAIAPTEALRGVRHLLRAPRNVAARVGRDVAAFGAFALPGASRPAPSTPLNVPIGPHRRFEWARGDLPLFKAIKDALGGTVNDVVLTVVAGALGRFLRARGEPTDDVVVKALVPVSVRAEVDQGALGNKVAAMWAPLPVGLEDPRECFEVIHEAMAGLKESGQAVGAQILTELTGFAPPTIMAQAARLQARQRFFNLVVTNVPGPQFPLFLMGRRMEAIYPLVPLAGNQALGIAILSYDGALDFGLNADFDAMPDLAELTTMLEDAILALADAAGVGTLRRAAVRRRRPARRHGEPVGRSG